MSKPFNASDPDTTTLTINCEPTVAKKVSGDPGQVVDELVRQTVPVAACALSTTAGNIGSMLLPVPFASPADRKSTRLNSSHVRISYAVFCLKKKKEHHRWISPTY